MRLKRDARRLVCCFQYHVNIDYLRKSLNLLFAVNNKTTNLLMHAFAAKTTFFVLLVNAEIARILQS